MKRRLIITILGLTLVGSAMAQGRGIGKRTPMGGRGMGDGPGMSQGGGWHQMLDLTEEQQAQAKTLFTEHLKAMKPNRDALAEKQVKLDALRTADKVDAKAIDKLIEEIGAIKIDMAKKREAHRQAFQSILTEEQRVLLNSHPRGGRGGRGGRGRPGRGGGMGEGRGFGPGSGACRIF